MLDMMTFLSFTSSLPSVNERYDESIKYYTYVLYIHAYIRLRRHNNESLISKQCLVFSIPSIICKFLRIYLIY